jgi:glycosyltransferase involved in cell wall biosynthesis
MTKDGKKMLFFSPASELGGAERSLIDLIKALERMGMKGHVILPVVFYLCIAVFQLPLYVWRLRRLVRICRADFAHSNGIKMHILLPWLIMGTNCDGIIHLRDFVEDNRVIRFLIGRACRKVSQVWANSKAVGRYFISKGIRVQVIPNVVDVRRFSVAPIPSRGRYRLGCFGVLTPWKGQVIFLKLLKELQKVNSQFHGWIVGGEIYDTAGEKGYGMRLREFADALKLGDKVVFKGFQSNMESLMRQCQFVIHTSLKPEPFGRVIIEAMASGRIVIAAKAGGPEEIITDMEDGCLVPPGRVEAYVRCMEELLAHPELQDKIARNARKTVLDHYTLDALCRRLEAVIT